MRTIFLRVTTRPRRSCIWHRTTRIKEDKASVVDQAVIMASLVTSNLSKITFHVNLVTKSKLDFQSIYRSCYLTSTLPAKQSGHRSMWGLLLRPVRPELPMAMESRHSAHRTRTRLRENMSWNQFFLFYTLVIKISFSFVRLRGFQQKVSAPKFWLEPVKSGQKQFNYWTILTSPQPLQ